MTLITPTHNYSASLQILSTLMYDAQTPWYDNHFFAEQRSTSMANHFVAYSVAVLQFGLRVQVAKPKLEMVVPYKQYKLVRADGTAPERVTKHPFCMSRVHYSAAGKYSTAQVC